MPSAKLGVIYPVPTDRETFERLYHDHHVPMAVKKLVGKTKIVATKVLSSAKETLASAVSISTGGPPIFIVAEEETFMF